MPIETTGVNPSNTQEVEVGAATEHMESELSLETTEQADVRVTLAMGQITENNHIAEAAQAADAVETQPKIEDIRQSLGLPREKQTETSAEVAMIRDAVETNTVNLERRMRGEITGIELDRLNAENEQQIDNARAEMRRQIDEAQSRRNNAGDSAQTMEFPIDDSPQEVVVPPTASSVEQVDDTKSEGSRFKKSSESELFTSNIESAADIRSLMRRLSELGDITAPDGYVYKKEDMLNTIGLLKDSKDPNLQRVTNNHGLRDKVRKLLLQREIS